MKASKKTWPGTAKSTRAGHGGQAWGDSKKGMRCQKTILEPTEQKCSVDSPDED